MGMRKVGTSAENNVHNVVVSNLTEEPKETPKPAPVKEPTTTKDED